MARVRRQRRSWMHSGQGWPSQNEQELHLPWVWDVRPGVGAGRRMGARLGGKSLLVVAASLPTEGQPPGLLPCV